MSIERGILVAMVAQQLADPDGDERHLIYTYAKLHGLDRIALNLAFCEAQRNPSILSEAGQMVRELHHTLGM